jgi:glyoxylase-like metal-dependent hydrolase (beta-lactamase superfamily II)
VVLVSHFHDDHVSAIPVLQRLFGTQCWAAESFADLLAQPAAHRFPCNAPEPIRIDRRLGFEEKVRWEEFEFDLASMSGHTRFAALIGFEADGLKYAHTGDQYLFFSDETPFAERRRFQNHVYANGALSDGYRQSADWLLARRPHIVLNGHEPPYVTDDGFFGQMEAWANEYAETHRAIMPVAEGDTHFDFDSWGGWIWPYRTLRREPGMLAVTVTVRNPLPRAATLHVRLVGPAGWQGTEASLSAGPREEVSCELGILVPSEGRRQAFALELEADGQRFGQVAEALVTVGGKFF